MSTVKKNARRRQKKQFLDQEDLNTQKDSEVILDGLNNNKRNEMTGDMFDAAKLQQNYFRRLGNKSQINEGAIVNFEKDQEEQINHEQNSQNQDITKEQKKQRHTDKKRRRKPAKKQAIFQPQQQQQNQNQYQRELPLTSQIHSPLKNQTQQASKTQESSKITKKQQAPFQQQQSKQHQNNKKKKDDFDNIIKNQQEEQQDSDMETVVNLHVLMGKLDKDERKQYYYQPLGPGEVAYGYFKRFSSGLSQVYQLTGEDHRPLLFCQNQRGCIGCNYYISMTKQMDKNKPSYLGKLRGNASGSTYMLYDCGIQPKNQFNRSDWRVSMAAIQYQSNFMGFNGPRKLKVTTPSPKHFQDPDTFKLSQEQSILNLKPPVVAEFRNKTPNWNQKLKSYALNFGGRVKLASIKNFILIDNTYEINEEDEASNIIVFGKVDENTFSVQYRHPLSMYQAFGIVMSQFDFKLNCE